MAIGNFVQVCLGWASCGGWRSPIRGGGAATGGGEECKGGVLGEMDAIKTSEQRLLSDTW